MSYLETGAIYCDDNLKRLSQFRQSASTSSTSIRPSSLTGTTRLLGDEAEVRSFEDRWEGRVQVCVNWMKERMIELHRILRPTGTVFMHCDWHASHYLELMMDSIFDRGRFINEIIWHYTSGGRNNHPVGGK